MKFRPLFRGRSGQLRSVTYPFWGMKPYAAETYAGFIPKIRPNFWYGFFDKQLIIGLIVHFHLDGLHTPGRTGRNYR